MGPCPKSVPPPMVRAPLPKSNPCPPQCFGPKSVPQIRAPQWSWRFGDSVTHSILDYTRASLGWRPLQRTYHRICDIDQKHWSTIGESRLNINPQFCCNVDEQSTVEKQSNYPTRCKNCQNVLKQSKTDVNELKQFKTGRNELKLSKPSQNGLKRSK